jgi:hypothetical protein
MTTKTASRRLTTGELCRLANWLRDMDANEPEILTATRDEIAEAATHCIGKPVAYATVKTVADNTGILVNPRRPRQPSFENQSLALAHAVAYQTSQAVKANASLTISAELSATLHDLAKAVLDRQPKTKAPA